MIRLTLALLTTLFVGFVIAGADRGQVRYGLMTTADPAIAAPTVSPETVVTASSPAVQPPPAKPQVVQAIYVPAQPLIVAPQTEAEPATQTADATPATPAPEILAPEIPTLAEPEKLVRFVAVSSANVREGPSKGFAVIEKLARGEAVSVISATEDPDGWSLIRIEGDGLEGYVSNTLLADQP